MKFATPRLSPRPWLADARGFTGAEKALLITFALAIILLIGSLVRGGSQQAAGDAQRTLASALADSNTRGVQSALGGGPTPQATEPNTARPQAPGLLTASTKAFVTTSPVGSGRGIIIPAGPGTVPPRCQRHRRDPPGTGPPHPAPAPRRRPGRPDPAAGPGPT